LGVKGLPNLRSADLDLKPGENEQRSARTLCVVQQIRHQLCAALSGFELKLSFCLYWKRLDSQAIGQGRSHAFEVLARAGRDHQGRGKRDFGGAMPLTQAKECIGAHEAEQNPLGGNGPSQVDQGLQSIVWFTVRTGGVSERDLEPSLAGDCQAGHGNAIFKARGRSQRLERLRANRNEDDSVELKRLARRPCHRQMPEVRGIETSPKERHTLTRRLLLHLPMLTPRQAAIDVPWTRDRSASIGDTTMRFVIAFLAVAGVVVSSLALQVHYSTETEPCSINAKWDCGIVNHSPFAEIAHIPVAALGIAGYLAMGALALLKRRRLVEALALGALGFSLYLTYIEKYVLEVYCIYCVTSLGIIVIINLLSLWWVVAEWRASRTA
jgi:vitamin-K-epoxide reductase (warfarin-sensitive)